MTVGFYPTRVCWFCFALTFDLSVTHLASCVLSLLCEAVTSMLLVCSFVVVGFGKIVCILAVGDSPVASLFVFLIKVIFSFHSNNKKLSVNIVYS